MTDPDTTSRDRGPTAAEHDPAEATRWFDQWDVYRSIVDHDWMCHRRIFGETRDWVLVRHPGPFTLLDLGCGDCGFVRGTFEGTGLWAYTGVDASPSALARAHDELAGARFQVRLLEADMLAFLREEPRPDGETFDVILASYAVHHLPTREKRELFRRAAARLSPRGSLLFADIFRRHDETREQYLDAYVGMMRREWKALSPEALAGTCEHVIGRDFPETGEAIRDMAREAGLTREPSELFRDSTGFHRLLAFTKEPVA